MKKFIIILVAVILCGCDSQSDIRKDVFDAEIVQPSLNMENVENTEKLRHKQTNIFVDLINYTRINIVPVSDIYTKASAYKYVKETDDFSKGVKASESINETIEHLLNKNVACFNLFFGLSGKEEQAELFPNYERLEQVLKTTYTSEFVDKLIDDRVKLDADGGITVETFSDYKFNPFEFGYDFRVRSLTEDKCEIVVYMKTLQTINYEKLAEYFNKEDLDYFFKTINPIQKTSSTTAELVLENGEWRIKGCYVPKLIGESDIYEDEFAEGFVHFPMENIVTIEAMLPNYF